MLEISHEAGTLTIDAITLLGGLATQFIGIVWYSRGLVSELKSVVRKVDEMEKQMAKDRHEVSPIIHNFAMFTSTMRDNLNDLKSEIRQLRMDIKER